MSPAVMMGTCLGWSWTTAASEEDILPAAWWRAIVISSSDSESESAARGAGSGEGLALGVCLDLGVDGKFRAGGEGVLEDVEGSLRCVVPEFEGVGDGDFCSVGAKGMRTSDSLFSPACEAFDPFSSISSSKPSISNSSSGVRGVGGDGVFSCACRLRVVSDTAIEGVRRDRVVVFQI